MKTIYIILIFFLFSTIGFAQIGINTTTPNAMLDVSSTTNGLLIPRIALTANNVAAPVVNPQGGALITSTMIYNTATVAGVNGVLPGYYYWSGTLWTPFTGTISNDWKLIGNTAITTPAIPVTYGTSTIGASENFIGTTDVNDVVIGSNNVERMRFRSTGFIGVGTANPAYKLHITKDTAGSVTTYSENTFVGNTNGTGIFGSSFNNPGYGIGGQFSGGSNGVIAQAFGSTSTFTVRGIIATATGSGNGFREGGNFSATGVNISNKGVVSDANGATTSNYGGLFSASGGTESYGGQFSASAATTNYAGDFSIFSAATTNYGGKFSVNNGSINYAGYFQALGGTKNYAIIVPNLGGTIGFGTITPNAILDISSTTNGVLLPRIALVANNVAAPVVNPQGGALPISTMIYNTATIAGLNGVSPGYYYWNGTLWLPFNDPNVWKLYGNSATNDPVNPGIYGTSTIGSTESFVGTLDANDVVIGTNNIERLRVKQTTGNIGIGTATPVSKLDVSGDLALREGAAITVNAGANAITLTSKYSHYRLIGPAGNFTINSISSGNDGQIITLINTASNVVMTISNEFGATANSILTGTGSNLTCVVANTNNNHPSVTLIYNSTVSRWIVTSSVGFRNPNNWEIYGNTTITTPSTPGVYGTSTILPTENFIGTANANDVVVGTNNIERLRVKQTTGNIGIGTVSPVSKLDLSGDLALREGTAIPVVAGANSIILPGKFSHYRLTGATGAFSITNIATGNNGQLLTLINTTSNVMTISNNFGSDGIMTGTGVPIVIPGLVNSSVTLIFNQTLGLWVVTSNSGIIANEWKLNGNSAITTPAIPAIYGTSTIGATENFVGTTDANDIVIGTNNIERMRIDKSSGNISIGSSNTSFSKLDVLSNVINLPSISGTNTNSCFAQGKLGITGIGVYGSCNGDPIQNTGGFFTSAGGGVKNIGAVFSAFGGLKNYAIIVPANQGDVGIGTFTPTTKLDIVSPGNTLGLRLLSGNNSQLSYLSVGKATEYAEIGACTAGTFFSDALDGDMAIKNFNSGKILLGASFIANAAMAIIPGGNVGIGTSSPTHKFHVTTGALNTSTAFIENTSIGGIGVEGSALGNFGSGIGGKFTGTSVGVQGNGVPSSGATNVLGGYFNATGSVGNTSYGVNATGTGATSNFGGAFYAVGASTTNTAGYFSATGAPFNNYAIIVPANEGRVGIGTSAPVDQLEVAGGYVRSTGYRCRTGTGGTYPGNTFNINWNGSSPQLWIDTFNIGTFQFTSDRRLKDNIVIMPNTAITRVMQLKPVSFKYKNIPNTIFKGSDVTNEGFIADELQEIIPSAVNGDKNALTSEGKIQPQTLNMPPVVSVLTKAIQEQQAIIEDLKTKNNQLEQRLKAIEERLGK